MPTMSQEAREPEAAGGNPDDETERAVRANRLYWGSDQSVNRIADELGLSKGSLYEIVQALPSELPCPQCGAEMAYPNRTAREKGFLTCTACGHEEEESGVREALVRGDLARVPHAPPAPDTPSLLDRGGDRRVLAGAALLGVAVGIVIGTFIRK